MPPKVNPQITRLKEIRAQLAKYHVNKEDGIISHSHENFHNRELVTIDAERNLEREKTELLLEEKKDVMGMRQEWSFWLLLCVILIVLSDIVLVFFIGFGLMSFESNNSIVIATIVDGVLKVLGLAGIVVAFLFNTKTLGKNND